jgi:hypothetical protein
LFDSNGKVVKPELFLMIAPVSPTMKINVFSEIFDFLNQGEK